MTYRVKQINYDCYIIERYDEPVDTWVPCDDYGKFVKNDADIVKYYSDEGKEDAINMIKFWLDNPKGKIVY